MPPSSSTIYMDRKKPTGRSTSRKIRQDAGWLERCGFEFRSWGDLTFYCQVSAIRWRQNASNVCEEAEQAYASVVKGLELEPAGKVTIKLYEDKEILRQSTDIRVAYLFNGWSEDGESVKLYARRDKGTFAPLIAHELVHKITLGISDSLNSWLAEGLATYFGNQPLRGGNVLEQGFS